MVHKRDFQGASNGSEMDNKVLWLERKGGRGEPAVKRPRKYLWIRVLFDRLLDHARHDRHCHSVDHLCRCVDQVDALRFGRLLAQDEQRHKGCQSDLFPAVDRSPRCRTLVGRTNVPGMFFGLFVTANRDPGCQIAGIAKDDAILGVSIVFVSCSNNHGEDDETRRGQVVLRRCRSG